MRPTISSKRQTKSENKGWLLFALFSFFSLALTSCNNDSDEPLTLHDVENNYLHLYYGTQAGVTIIGGSGDYTFSFESPLLKAEQTEKNYILFDPIGIGDAVVTIKDSSQKKYTLNVSITYRGEDFTISEVAATVVGDQMTVADQKELKEKAIETVPMKAGGVYKFVYTEGKYYDNKTKGIVYLYPTTTGATRTEGTFERESVLKEDGTTYSHELYRLFFENTSHTFIYGAVQKGATTYTAISSPYYLLFVEDLTDRFQADYPELEQVYTTQVIENYKMTAE